MCFWGVLSCFGVFWVLSCVIGTFRVFLGVFSGCFGNIWGVLASRLWVLRDEYGFWVCGGVSSWVFGVDFVCESNG